jgi:hypothetical protein
MFQVATRASKAKNGFIEPTDLPRPFRLAWSRWPEVPGTPPASWQEPSTLLASQTRHPLSEATMPAAINPFVYMQQIAGRLPSLTDRREIETLLDEVEYLYDALDPEMQEPAAQLIEDLRRRLALAA